MHFIIILTTIIWLITIFAFARWRVSRICRNEEKCNVMNDFPLQLYMKLSGVCLLFWIAGLIMEP
jgi:hypothetical protein